MIIQAFLRWVETARASDRAKAAGALARAYLRPDLEAEQRQAALMAMCHLLNDSAPQVRLAMAEALADSPQAPRAVILALAEDQAEIACTVIARSPVLTEPDLVDLAASNGSLTAGLIAARSKVTRAVSAALAEVGDEGTLLLLLENPNADIARRSLGRIAVRFGHCASIRRWLLERPDLPADARQHLVEQVSAALTGWQLARTVLPQNRLERLKSEACETALMEIAGDLPAVDSEKLIEQLRSNGKLTPALLMHALCTGRIAFFSSALVRLSRLEERRVHALLASGRMHAVRALFESAGLTRDVAMVFVEATLIWRGADELTTADKFCSQLLASCRRPADAEAPVSQLLNLVEKLQRREVRALARIYAEDATLAA
ncbi:uncharacterized protein (DUF2336 family) [Pseudorhizobium tarimense]|uniref:Uncharacterized protein (DUF2336 family) n=1 Tax=Pseudorhizobium tarimense TaxID=1079109 RepID=A0ABV2HDC4_9HYPH|nr:DUF2336 domain-containing protein [Pseudorhizobium tarimense]MCJ8521259.1 DUF2336 domain-containing protein [Pseudorhizobium tarimense]